MTGRKRNNKKQEQQYDGIAEAITTLIGRLPQPVQTALVVVVLLVAVTAGAILLFNTSEASLQNKSNATLSPTQINEIRSIGQWEFLSISDEEIADTVRTGILGSDHLVRIYKGTLRLGIDMADAKDGWISTDGDTAWVTLPPVKLLDENFLDEAATRPFYESGKWTPADRSKLAGKARRRMLERCLTQANIASAERNASAQFHQMMQAMGFADVRIRFQDKD